MNSEFFLNSGRHSNNLPKFGWNKQQTEKGINNEIDKERKADRKKPQRNELSKKDRKKER